MPSHQQALEPAPWLLVLIRGAPYQLVSIPSPSGSQWRLRKPGGQIYDLSDTSRGPTCDCADQTFRHDGIDRVGCKHIRALRGLGLIGRVPVSRRKSLARESSIK